MDSTVLPRDHLRACLLLVLAETSVHGYDVPALLGPLGLGAADRGSVYRMLRAMEAEGQVDSYWDSSPAGPSRRMYRVSPPGRDWAASASASLRIADAVMVTWLERYRVVVCRGVEVVTQVPAAG